MVSVASLASAAGTRAIHTQGILHVRRNCVMNLCRITSIDLLQGQVNGHFLDVFPHAEQIKQIKLRVIAERQFHSISVIFHVHVAILILNGSYATGLGITTKRSASTG